MLYVISLHRDYRWLSHHYPFHNMFYIVSLEKTQNKQILMMNELLYCTRLFYQMQSSVTVTGVFWAMSALAQHTQHSAHTMRTPTLQPVPESLPVADHVSSVANSKSVKSKVGAHLFDPSAPAVKKVISYNHLNPNPVKENQKRINIINFNGQLL